MPEATESYEIGAVAQLTGISSHVLRVWERRYDVVEPQRTDSKRRRYSKEDVQRLTMIKTLVDNGQSIGTVAKLDDQQLTERLNELSPEKAEPLRKVMGKCRIAIVGTLVTTVVREAVDRESALSIVGEFDSVDQVAQTLVSGGADLLIIERPNLFFETLAEIESALKSCGINRAIVVYQFGEQASVTSLETKDITALRSPVAAPELLRAIGEAVNLSNRKPGRTSPPTAAPTRKKGEQIPAIFYTDSDLARIARHSSIVKCECPHHLASLLSSLGAFEKYSLECESRDEEDAALHRSLYKATAQCRHEMEKALSRVLEHEGISVDDL